MSAIFRLLALLTGLAPLLLASDCLRLSTGHPIKVVFSPANPPCLVFEVQPGEPTQLVAQQPVDLKIRLIRDGVPILIDEFEFGSETASLDAPGQYRVQFETVSKLPAKPLTILVSRNAVSKQKSAVWQHAEDLASRSKRSGKPGDIAESLAAWEEVGDLAATARTYLEQGDAALAAGDQQQAATSYEHALVVCDSIGDTRCSAEAANNSGLVAQQLGEYDKAVARLRRAVRDWERVPNRELEGRTLSNLGLLFRQTGDYQQAIAYYDQASIILRMTDRLASARVLNNLGVCYQSLADYDQARSHFERALSQFLALGSSRDSVRAKLNLGRTRMLAGDNGAARRILNETLTEATSKADQSARADTLDNLGQALLADHLPVAAKTNLLEALELHRDLGDRRMQAFDLHYLGIAASALGELTIARNYLTEASEIRRVAGMRDAYTDSLVALAELERSAGNAPQARQLLDRALATLESVRSRVPGPALRATFYARQHKVFDLMLDLQMTPENPNATEDGFLAVERGRGRALLDLLAEGVLTRQLPDDLVKRRDSVERQIDLLAVRLSTASQDLSVDLRRQVERLVAEDEEIGADIRQALAEEKLGQPLSSVAELQRTLLPSHSAVIEYHLGEKQSYLWLVRTGDIQLFSLPPRAVIEAECAPVLELFSNILDRKGSPEKQRKFERALSRLSRTLVGPLRDIQLPATLIIVPDGILTRVPFAAIQVAGNGRLGLVHDLVQISSAGYLAAGRTPRRISDFPRAILAVADPVFSLKDSRVTEARQSRAEDRPDLALARLPFNGELESVSALVPAARRRILRGFDANPDELRRSRLQDYAVLHFSTHALIDDRIPELSRIALSMVSPSGRQIDGFLRASQLSEFPLSGSTVVLSACDTALGKQVLGEGLIGLTASLFHAGAAQLVLTVSDADGEASSAFFAEAYRNVFGARRASIEHSMTLARRALASSPRWADPYYWASFVVYGRPTEER